MPVTRVMAIEQRIDEIDKRIEELDKRSEALQKGTNDDILDFANK